VLTIAIFAISTLAVVNPAQAHFTLGNLTGVSRYHANDFDPHVAGPIGYVWPGGGQDAYSGAPNFATASSSPGYQSPYPGNNPPGAPSGSWYQLQGSAYAPFGAVLAGSTGDLIFALNATCLPVDWSAGCAASGTGAGRTEIQTALRNTAGWDTWFILIPPEFTVPDGSQVVTTLTNDYSKVLVAQLGPQDRYAPGWTLIAIGADQGNFPGYNHQWINFTNSGEWYYVRVNGVTAPTTAGRYFFKEYLGSGGTNGNTYGVGPSEPGACLAAGDTNYPVNYYLNAGHPYPNSAASYGDCGENPGVWVPPQNWPVMLVKGEVDPAIITGTLRYAGYNATLYSQPIREAGMVLAKMTMRLDPYTGQQRPDLPNVNAQAFVNATAQGHYEVEGLAPGVYDLYAQSAGFPQTLCESGVTVLKGQSLHFDCYLQPGAVIHGNVFTKHQFGDEPWPGNVTTGQYMKIELYTSPTLNHVPSTNASLVSWSPLPCVAGGQEYYYGRRAAGLCGDPRDGSFVAFPWHEYSTDANVAVPPTAGGPGKVNGYVRDVSMSGRWGTELFNSPYLTSDPEGVGHPQKWFVAGGTTTPFHFEMGLKGEYGAPKDLSGEVPQVYATWINGLTAGRYYVRAWTFRYVQSALDGSTFQEYYFDVTPNEWAGDVTLPLDLRLSSWVNKTVYFHNTVNGITTDPITTGAGFMWGYLKDANGQIFAYNVTALGYNNKYYQCAYDSFSYGNGYSFGENGGIFSSYNQFVGSGESGAPGLSCSPLFISPTPKGMGQVNFLDKAHVNRDAIAAGKAVMQWWGLNDTWGGDNYGIPSGTYQPTIGVDGYNQYTPIEQVSVTLSGNPTLISDHMYRGPGFNVTVYSIDWERPRVSRPWAWDEDQTARFGLGSEIDVGWYPVTNGTAGTLYDYLGDEMTFTPPSLASSGLYQGDGANPCVGEMTLDPDQTTCTAMDGGGRNVLAPSAGTSGGNAHGAYFGQSARYAFVGGATSGSYGFLRQKQLMRHQMFDTAITVWPLGFTPGQYNLRAMTYGYIQDKDYTAYATNGQVADIKINLIIGVNVSLQILFKKENIITPTPYNMSARIRLFDDSGNLVAEWMSSEGVYVTHSGFARAADGVSNGNENPLYPFIDSGAPKPQLPSSGLNGYNFLPGGVTLLTAVMAGLPAQPPFGNFGTTSSGVYFGDPVTGPAVAGPIPDFEMDNFPAAYAQYPFPNYGIPGAPDYQGGWTAEVDFVNYYLNNSASMQPMSEGLQIKSGPTTSLGEFPQYYPPVPGLLMGESYHIIPGTVAKSGISLTEDMALSGTFISPPHSMAPNHLGPYSQRGTWAISGTHNSGEASAIFEVDLNGFITGNVLAFTWSNEFRPLSWGAITVTGAGLPSSGLNFYTYDGVYEAYLPVATAAVGSTAYTFTLNAPGYAPYTWTSQIPSGSTGVGNNVYLEQSNIPVPEFSSIAIIAFAALAASLYVLRRRRK